MFAIPGYPDFQFGSLFCIGRNYAEHAREMESDIPEEPVVFLKPRSSLIFDGGAVVLPSQSLDVHHEVELVVLIGSKTRNVNPEAANRSILAVGVGLDVTARDLQSFAKKKGLPWSLAKGFDTFSPVGNLAEFSNGLDLDDLEIELRVNGELRQSGNTSGMLFSVREIISYLSKRFTLYPGDLIFTGTPEGVGAIRRGDHISAKLGTLHEDISTLQVHVST